MNGLQATISEQERTISQGELGLLGGADYQLVDLPIDFVSRCDTEQAAFRECILRSRVRFNQEDLAAELGMTKGSFNTILNSDCGKRVRTLSRTNQIKLQQICGNRAIDQWADLYAKGMLNCQRTVQDREAALLEELAKLRAETNKLDQLG